MQEIIRSDIEKHQGGFRYYCTFCGSMRWSLYKGAATRAIDNRTKCINCRTPYQVDRIETNEGIYRNEDGKWCCKCSGCEKEQAYTRADHARQSLKAGWKCKGCASFKNYISRAAYYRGFRVVDFDSCKRGAKGRSLSWDLEIEDLIAMWDTQNGCCALTGLPMQKNPKTWSIDRIDNERGYTKDNIHLVLTYVNMMRGKYSIKQFIETAKAIADHNP